MAYGINSEDIKSAKISQILILFNVITFVILNVILNDPTYFFMFTQEKTAVISGEYWRLLSSIFIHGDIGHLINNMIGLLLYGTMIELRFSKKFYIFTYIILFMLNDVSSNPILTNIIFFKTIFNSLIDWRG